MAARIVSPFPGIGIDLNMGSRRMTALQFMDLSQTARLRNMMPKQKTHKGTKAVPAHGERKSSTRSVEQATCGRMEHKRKRISEEPFFQRPIQEKFKMRTGVQN